jgi:hypothetical protein
MWRRRREMRNLLIGLLSLVVLGTAGYAAAAGLDDADPARTVSLPAATTTDDTTTTAETTTTGTTTVGTTTAATTTGDVEDVSGPCDEAEHADDPRCTGAAAQDRDDDHAEDRDDHSGHGSGGDDDDHGGDHSGSSSGRG